MSRRHVAATSHFVCTGEFLWKSLLLQQNLSPQQVAQIQSDLIFCDFVQRQNSAAETKIFTKILQYKRSDLSLRRVASLCCCNCRRPVHTEWSVAATCVVATCRLVGTDLKSIRATISDVFCAFFFCIAMVTVYKEPLSMGSNVNNKGCTLPMYLECAYNWYLLILENRLYKIFLQNYKSNHGTNHGTNHACCHNYL